MNQELKLVFRNSIITAIIMFIYGIIVGQKSVYIAFTLGAMASLLNLYWIFKDAEVLAHAGGRAVGKRKSSFFKRFFLNGVFLYLMIRVDLQWFVASSIGLLVVKFNIFLLMLNLQFNNIRKKTKL